MAKKKTIKIEGEEPKQEEVKVHADGRVDPEGVIVRTEDGFLAVKTKEQLENEKKQNPSE